ncbi:MAG: hypothetical protein HXX81_04120 [Campylobacterales bacterium]|nr:hypothetical protein [Campylobacterales bacterium]
MIKKPKVEKMLNGTLAELVGVTAGCSVVEPSGALFIGITSAIVVFFAEILLLKLKIDDPCWCCSCSWIYWCMENIGISYFCSS